MSGFSNSFEKSFSIGQQKGSDAALESIKEKMKLEQTKADETKKVAGYLNLATDYLKDADPDTQKRMGSIIGDNTKEWTSEAAKDLVDQIKSVQKDKTDFQQTMQQERFKSGMIGVSEVIKAFAERGGTFADGTPITASSLQDFGKQASDRLLADIGAMPQGQPQNSNISQSIMSQASSQEQPGTTQKQASSIQDDSLLNKPIRSKASFKAEEKTASDIATAEKTSKGTYRFMQQFDRSINELKKFDPEFDKVGASGWLSRKGASIAEHLDELPETSALKIQVLPMANAMAREIEGGKVTDNDRKIYADSFANGIQNPNVTNMRLMSQSVIGLLDKGGNENGKITNQLQMLAKSDTDMFRGVISQVLEEYPELASQIYGEDYEVVE